METKKKITTKAKFYFDKKLKCHIKITPTGFVNGILHSKLIDDLYFWFEDIRKEGQHERLFLVDIHDIKDYEEIIE